MHACSHICLILHCFNCYSLLAFTLASSWLLILLIAILITGTSADILHITHILDNVYVCRESLTVNWLPVVWGEEVPQWLTLAAVQASLISLLAPGSLCIIADSTLGLIQGGHPLMYWGKLMSNTEHIHIHLLCKLIRKSMCTDKLYIELFWDL